MYEARGCNFTRPEAHILRRAGDLPPSRIRDERPFILHHRITKEKVYLNNALAKIVVERRSQFGRNHPYKSVDETPSQIGGSVTNLRSRKNLQNNRLPNQTLTSLTYLASLTLHVKSTSKTVQIAISRTTQTLFLNRALGRSPSPRCK